MRVSCVVKVEMLDLNSVEVSEKNLSRLALSTHILHEFRIAILYFIFTFIKN